MFAVARGKLNRIKLNAAYLERFRRCIFRQLNVTTLVVNITQSESQDARRVTASMGGLYPNDSDLQSIFENDAAGLID